ncbi:hypothetical protein ABIC65_000623 [Sphingomonas trueperi]
MGRVDAALAALEATHGVVLDPHSGEPWVLHPTRARRPQPGSRGIRKDGG